MCPWGHTVFQTPSLQSPPRTGRAPSAELGPLPPLTFTLPPPPGPLEYLSAAASVCTQARPLWVPPQPLGQHPHFHMSDP